MFYVRQYLLASVMACCALFALPAQGSEGGSPEGGQSLPASFPVPAFWQRDADDPDSFSHKAMVLDAYATVTEGGGTAAETAKRLNRTYFDGHADVEAAEPYDQYATLSIRTRKHEGAELMSAMAIVMNVGLLPERQIIVLAEWPSDRSQGQAAALTNFVNEAAQHYLTTHPLNHTVSFVFSRLPYEATAHQGEDGGVIIAVPAISAVYVLQAEPWHSSLAKLVYDRRGFRTQMHNRACTPVQTSPGGQAMSFYSEEPLAQSGWGAANVIDPQHPGHRSGYVLLVSGHWPQMHMASGQQVFQTLLNDVELKFGPKK